MKIFVTGASGHIGSQVVAELLKAGHSVVGLARSDESAAKLQGMGAEVQRGDIEDLDVLRSAAATSDGVIHLAFRHDIAFTRADGMAEAAVSDLAAITAIGEVLAGSNKPFVTTSGTLMLAFGGITGRAGTENDVLQGDGRIASENKTIELAQDGVRSSVIRLSPTVHGPTDFHGFIPSLIAIARKTGISGYVGDGANRWPAVHTVDAAVLYRLAVEKAPAGSRLHGAAEEGVAFKDIAEAIGHHLNIPVQSIAAEEAQAHFGFLSAMVGQDNPTSNAITKALLDWIPQENTLLEDLKEDHYFKE